LLISSAQAPAQILSAFIAVVIALTLLFAVCCTAIFFLLRERRKQQQAVSSGAFPHHAAQGSISSFDSVAPIKDKYATQTTKSVSSSHPRETSTSTLGRLASAFRAFTPSLGTRTGGWRRAATEDHDDDDAWDAHYVESGREDAELGMRRVHGPRPVTVVHETERRHPSDRAEEAYDVVQYPTLGVSDPWDSHHRNNSPIIRRPSISSLSETSTIIAPPRSPPLRHGQIVFVAQPSSAADSKALVDSFAPQSRFAERL
jgi:hypothetical protein